MKSTAEGIVRNIVITLYGDRHTYPGELSAVYRIDNHHVVHLKLT